MDIYGYSLVTMLHFHECLKISSELWAISVITNSLIQLALTLWSEK